MGDPGNVMFYLSIHDDVPAGVDAPHSHPGEMLWQQVFTPGEFGYSPYATDLIEGFYDPYMEWYEPYADNTCWEYIFHISDSQFVQQGSEIEPVIYWLDVQAMPMQEGPQFGWKTSIDHWNDDATWAIGLDPFLESPWFELRYPPMHPWMGESIDLAFAIYGEAQAPCDCLPGDANGDGSVNVGDAVYLIAYVFKGGPPPTPYQLCSGDANCDCAVNVGDAVYIIAYVFKGGPPPCNCTGPNPPFWANGWLEICGPPLRK
jgi:hypothetical protein